MPEHEGEPSPREDVPSPPAQASASPPPPPVAPLPPGEVLLGAECACRLSRVRRDIARTMRLLSETEERLCLDDEELAGMRLTSTEAERLDRFCLNLKVALDEMQRWARSLTGTVESLAGRHRRFDA